MIRSLALILIPLVVITIIFTNVPADHPVKEVDWKPVLAKARKEAPFEVLAPANLPEGGGPRVSPGCQWESHTSTAKRRRATYGRSDSSAQTTCSSISIRAISGLKTWSISSPGPEPRRKQCYCRPDLAAVGQLRRPYEIAGAAWPELNHRGVS